MRSKVDCVRGGKGRCGQTLVEFAIVLPMALIMIVGIIELGVLVNQHLVLANAAREGARTAAVGRTTSSIQSRVLVLCTGVTVSPSDIQIQFSNNDGSSWSALGNAGTGNAAAPGDLVQVTIEHPYNDLFSLIPGLSNHTIEKSVVMRREAM